MDAFSDMLKPVQLRLEFLNIQDFDSRLLRHWWVEMSHNGGIYTGKITKRHKSRFFLVLFRVVYQHTTRCTFSHV